MGQTGFSFISISTQFRDALATVSLAIAGPSVGISKYQNRPNEMNTAHIEHIEDIEHCVLHGVVLAIYDAQSSIESSSKNESAKQSFQCTKVVQTTTKLPAHSFLGNLGSSCRTCEWGLLFGGPVKIHQTEHPKQTLTSPQRRYPCAHLQWKRSGDILSYSKDGRNNRAKRFHARRSIRLLHAAFVRYSQLCAALQWGMG